MVIFAFIGQDLQELKPALSFFVIKFIETTYLTLNLFLILIKNARAEFKDLKVDYPVPLVDPLYLMMRISYLILWNSILQRLALIFFDYFLHWAVNYLCLFQILNDYSFFKQEELQISKFYYYFKKMNQQDDFEKQIAIPFCSLLI